MSLTPRWRLERTAIDVVEVEAPTEEEARRQVEAWDRTYPLFRAARPPEQTGVAWLHERYWMDATPVPMAQPRLHEEGEGDAP